MRVSKEAALNITASWLPDLFREVSAEQAEDRAKAFEWAMPRPGDWNGRSTPEQLEARCARLQAIAAAHRNKAALIRRTGAW